MHAASRAQRPSLGLHIDGMKSRKLTAKTIVPRDIRHAVGSDDDQDPYDTYDPTAQEQDEEEILDAALLKALNLKVSSTVGRSRSTRRFCGPWSQRTLIARRLLI